MHAPMLKAAQSTPTFSKAARPCVSPVFARNALRRNPSSVMLERQCSYFHGQPTVCTIRCAALSAPRVATCAPRKGIAAATAAAAGAAAESDSDSDLEGKKATMSLAGKVKELMALSSQEEQGSSSSSSDDSDSECGSEKGSDPTTTKGTAQITEQKRKHSGPLAAESQDDKAEDDSDADSDSDSEESESSDDSDHDNDSEHAHDKLQIKEGNDQKHSSLITTDVEESSDSDDDASDASDEDDSGSD